VEFNETFLSTATLRRRAGEGSFEGKSTEVFVLVTWGLVSRGPEIDSVGEAALSTPFNGVDGFCID